jgi:hypothetical protein
MSEEKKISKVMFFQPWYTTLIQIAVALLTLALFLVMCDQLGRVRHEQAISLRPYVHLEIEKEDPIRALQLHDTRNLGEENEIWVLGYWVMNVGKYPAKNVYVRAEWSSSPEFDSPGTFDNKDPMMVNPAMRMFATSTDLARSEVIRRQDQGKTVYRHGYVKYEDNDGNQYYSKATWILSEYEVGSPVRWRLLTNEGS